MDTGVDHHLLKEIYLTCVFADCYYILYSSGWNDIESLKFLSK